MNNPTIYNFLCQYDQNEWDAILEDLILYSINKIKEIEKTEEVQKKKEMPKYNLTKNSGIILFNNNDNGVFESATNYLKQNAKNKSYSCSKNNTIKKLDELNKKINSIRYGDKNRKSKNKNK